VFRREGEGRVIKSRCDPCEFIGDRSHRRHLERGILKLLPLSSLHLAAARKNCGALERRPLTGFSWLTVVGKACLKRTEEELACSRIADPSSDRSAIFNQANRSAELRNASNELTGTIQRV